jgi:3-oxosteroid 1-dehydrogenase
VTGMPDYHPEQPGGHDGKNSRTFLPDLFNLNELGEAKVYVRPNPTQGIPMRNSEMEKWNAMGTPQNIDFEMIAKRMEEGWVSFGMALIGYLYKGALERKIEMVLNIRALDLIVEEGRVIGLRAEKDGKECYIHAPKGVVLACGGFEWNETLKKSFLPGPITHPNSVPHNEGDGLKMAMAIGAELGNMSEAWGWSATIIPGEEYAGRQLNRGILVERNLPHSIMVNKKGERFVNEAANYNTMFKKLWAMDENTMELLNLPCWMIIDQQFKDKYALMTIMPGEEAPEWLERSDTLEDLARKVGIDPNGLSQTVKQWNQYVLDETDPDFQRGLSVYDALWGDPSNKPNAAMGSLEKPPFYAIRLYCGTLGTKGGPRTNTNGQVMHANGSVIEGLYAAGNVMASVCGPAYWGGGATVGPAMTFGYIAGRHAAQTKPE